MTPSLRCFDCAETFRRSAVKNFTTLLTGVWAHIYQPIRTPDHVQLMFHHEEGISRSLQRLQSIEERFCIGGMKTRRRLIQHIDDAKEIGV
jgi:hypothetical protein